MNNNNNNNNNIILLIIIIITMTIIIIKYEFQQILVNGLFVPKKAAIFKNIKFLYYKK